MTKGSFGTRQQFWHEAAVFWHEAAMPKRKQEDDKDPKGALARAKLGGTCCTYLDYHQLVPGHIAWYASVGSRAGVL